MSETVCIGLHGREILDSRGNPTVACDITLSDGTTETAMVPSGASTGSYEAAELRDKEDKRYAGKGVKNAVLQMETKLFEAIEKIPADKQEQIDEAMIAADGTPRKEKTGANAMLAVSLAMARAAAKSRKLPLYAYLGGCRAREMPIPMMNVLNGGRHSKNTLDVQEFMIVPVRAESMRERVRMCTEVYHTLEGLLSSKGYQTAVGDEGGFAPNLENEEEAMELLLRAIKSAGYGFGKDGEFMLALDVAASEWRTEKEAFQYRQPKSKKTYTTEELISRWDKLVTDYPILSLEDPLDEEDFEGFQKITRKLGEKISIVGDDLFVTNTNRIGKGIRESLANALLVKPNQIGTLTETMRAVKMAKAAHYITIMSHRSGETEDATIADLAVGLGTEYIKTGAPCRAERTAKYNRLMQIEEELG